MDTDIIKRLMTDKTLADGELAALLETDRYDASLFEASDRVRREAYGTDVYLRGLIEFSNYCKNDCYYCGMRRGNGNTERYRLSKEEILSCCGEGHDLGFRTFVLQSGEDPFYSDSLICEITSAIREKYPDCAITLSIGERSYESYEKFFAAGANRYLLRHETADEGHYRRLHPEAMSLEARKECLRGLKAIGFQVGSGFMVGSPYQKTAHLIEDLRFLQELKPDMIGIGPYLVHKDTPFKDFENGSEKLCLRLIAVLRLMFPLALLPATTALGTISPNGRELGLQAGANVLMPNLSPVRVRKFYQPYDNKICTGEEAAECKGCLEMRVINAGYRIVVSRGDAKTREYSGPAGSR